VVESGLLAFALIYMFCTTFCLVNIMMIVLREFKEKFQPTHNIYTSIFHFVSVEQTFSQFSFF
jgi:hypothetical protein